MGFLWDFYGVLMGFLWDFNRICMGCSWILGDFMGFLWVVYFCGIFMDFGEFYGSYPRVNIQKDVKIKRVFLRKTIYKR